MACGQPNDETKRKTSAKNAGIAESATELISSWSHLLTEQVNFEQQHFQQLQEQNDVFERLNLQQDEFLKNQNGLLDQIDSRNQQQVDSLTKIGDQMETLAESVSSLTTRVDSTADLVEQNHSTLKGISEQPQPDAGSSLDSSAIDKLTKCMDSLNENIQRHEEILVELLDRPRNGTDPIAPAEPAALQDLTALVEMLIEKVDQDQSLRDDLASPTSVAADPDDNGDSEFDWQARKQELLSDLGEGKDKSPASMKREQAETEDTSPDGNYSDEIDPKQESHAAESVEVADLQQAMEEKLRQAEIEISVERAKVARIQQELDKQRTELEREFAKREEKLKMAGKCVKKGRWSRFMGGSQNAED